MHAITGSETLNARFPGQWFQPRSDRRAPSRGVNRQRQAKSGLHYNWHRHYDPTIGRYTQPDPLGFVDGPSVYAYARNAPHEYVDPTGEFVPLILPITGGIAGGLAYDYAIDKVKSSCGCNSSGTTAGALGNAAVGVGIGATGRFVRKPRTGIAGGGRSGSGTSVFSTIGGSRFRRIGRLASYGIPGLGFMLVAKDIDDIGACLGRK
ncbi:MAG: RHS repeat-associated core domain-containing protein [Hyphomicrobium sp.]